MSLVSWLTPWKPATIDDRALVERRAQPARGDVDDPRLAVAGRGDDAGLRAGERPRLVAVRGDGDGQQRHRDPLAGGEQHVELAAGRVVGDLAGQVEQLVGACRPSRRRRRRRRRRSSSRLTIRSATRFMCAADATEEPPYFWTTRATGPQATEVAAGDRRLRPRRARDVIIGWTIPEHWLLSAEERGNPHTALPAGPRATSPSRWCTAARTSTGWSTRCGRWTRATTCSSPTGGAIPTSGCATTARRWPSCSPRR